MIRLVVAVVLAAGATLDIVRPLDRVALLPGEPRAVSAAGITRSDRLLETLENPTPFEPGVKRRLLIVGGDAGSTDAILAAVRWFKTRARAAVRDAWTLSALPAADLTAPHVARWIAFQAPDLVVELRSDGTNGSVAAQLTGEATAGLGFVRVETLRASDVPQALERMLRAAAAQGPSLLREAILRRVRRDPLEVARLLAVRYPQTPAMSYIPAVAWINTLRLAAIAGDETLRAKVREQTRPWISGERTLFGNQAPLTAVAGTMIFADLASLGGGDREAAVALVTEGANRASLEKAGGIPQNGQGWTDDMFMATAILARAGSLPGRERDLDRAASLIAGYAARLQRADGLFNHAADAPVAWGRGNGFAAFGLMETLAALPDRHPARARLIEINRRHVEGLKRMQAPDGMWRQVIDEPGSYRELTATAMVVAAMARGIRLGWLDSASRPAVERGWRALSAHVAEDGSLVDVCASTGAGPTKRYYLDRPALTGADDRGGAMALLASVEMHELRLNR